MARVLLFIVVLFAILLVLRSVRLLLAAMARRARGGPPVDGEMVKDPVCGTWIDRRLALAGRRGDEWLPVCSEKCRKALESA